MNIKNIATLAVLALVLIGCSKENSALEEFKKSSAAQEVNQCVGANGSVAWDIFQPTDNKNPEVRVIQATLTKGANKLEMQWLYNLTTKISELAFAGKPGEKTSRLMMGMELGIFCMQSSSAPLENNNSSQSKARDGEECIKEIIDSKVVVLGKLNAYLDNFPQLDKAQKTYIQKLQDENKALIASNPKSFKYGYDYSLEEIKGVLVSEKGRDVRLPSKTYNEAFEDIKWLISAVSKKDESVSGYRSAVASKNNKKIDEFLESCKQGD